ncbi:MAG: hypothetical protein N2246_07030, partial [Candidatus Sumerlaeia bacterium]|nr:hypothetical protein [Candidatus Sumerlaeia bacterium]
LYDGQRGYLYSMPEEVLISHCDSPNSFDERILSFLRDELAYNPIFFLDKKRQLASSQAKEIQKWLHQWELKLSGVADITRQGRVKFLHKLLLWRLAAETGTSDFARKKLHRYIFKEERLKLKQSKLPNASKDTFQVLESLVKDNNLEFCSITAEDIILLRQLASGNMLCRLLRELNLLSYCKISSKILAKYADLELKNKNRASIEARMEEEGYWWAKLPSKKLTRASLIIDAPIPYFVNLKFTGFEILLREITTALHEILIFRGILISERRKRKNGLFIQPDLFVPEQKFNVARQDILGALVDSGIRTTVYDEQSKDFAYFIITAALIELRYIYKFPLTRFPSLAPIFSV